MNYGSFQSGTEQGLHRNEQPPPTQQGAFPKGKGAVIANAVLAGGLGLHPIWEYGARETGDFLLVNSTHLERHYGGDRIKHSHTPPTMREKP